MVLGVNVNIVAVLVAAVVSTILGALWYGPLFGRTWMRLSGLGKAKPNQMKKKGMGKSYFLNFIATLVTAYVLAVFVVLAGATTIGTGVIVGFWVWLGFVATLTLGSVLWEGKSVNLYWLNNAYGLINLAVMAAILAVWP